MRVKDEAKQKALREATIKVVNQIGFASSSVAKIAKEAGISPATLYVYHKDKDELLCDIYTEIKIELAGAMNQGFDDSRPVRDIIKLMWLNGFRYLIKHRHYLSFIDQFANSPYVDVVDMSKIEPHFEPLIRVIQRGVEQKIIKDVHPELLKVFAVKPMMTLANQRQCGGFTFAEEHIEEAFQMAWDAIRL